MGVEESLVICVGIKNYLTAKLEVVNDRPVLVAKGSLKFLKLIHNFRLKIKNTNLVEKANGSSPEEIVFNELVAKYNKSWQYPYKDEELCHCRGVLTQVVDNSIIMGAHTPEDVSLDTSASTSCGACREDVIKIIDYRLGK